jgi:hypothetical protein
MGVIVPAATIFMLLLRLFKGEVERQKALVSLSIYVVLVIILTVLFWPYLWSDPWVKFIQAFANMSQFRWSYTVLYLGEMIEATALPWHYIPVWLGVTTPLLYIFLFLIGIMLVLRTMISRRWRMWANDTEWQDLFFLGLFLGPVAAVILLNSVLYDGWRQLYFIYPAFILLALRGWQGLFNWQITGQVRIWKVLVILITFSFLLNIALWMKAAHPFQNVYFNELAGKNIKTRFEVDYWGLSSRQALQYIADHSANSPVTVWAGSFFPLRNGKLMLEPSVRSSIKIVSNIEQADFIVTQYRRNLTDYAQGGRPFEIFYEIRVDKEAILSIYKRIPG